MYNQEKDFLIENLLLGAASIDFNPHEDVDEKSRQEVVRAKERARFERIEEFTALQKNFIEKMVGQFIAFICSTTALMTAVYMANQGENTMRVIFTIMFGFIPLIGAKVWFHLVRNK